LRASDTIEKQVNFSYYLCTNKERRDMLITNYKILNSNSPDPELKKFQKEYETGVSELMTKFPTGIIKLRRVGYPRYTPSPDPNIETMPEPPSPVYLKMTKTVDGVYWGYCRGRAKIEANGLADVPGDESTEELSGIDIAIDVRKNPDYAFFIMYKSGIVGVDFKVFDPEGDKIKELTKKNQLIQVQSSIRGMTDEKLRMMSQAWGIIGAGKKDVLILQDELESRVMLMESDKVKNPDNLMAKGMAEFLAEMKNDDSTRPKAIIQMALDEKLLEYKPANSHFYFGTEDVCFVPIDKIDQREEVLAKFLREEKNSEIWVLMLKTVVTPEYINQLDKHGCRWLASQVGIPLNKSEDALRTALLSEFTQG
jgi:hypothetical protein